MVDLQTWSHIPAEAFWLIQTSNAHPVIKTVCDLYNNGAAGPHSRRGRDYEIGDSDDDVRSVSTSFLRADGVRCQVRIDPTELSISLSNGGEQHDIALPFSQLHQVGDVEALTEHIT